MSSLRRHADAGPDGHRKFQVLTESYEASVPCLCPCPRVLEIRRPPLHVAVARLTALKRQCTDLPAHLVIFDVQVLRDKSKRAAYDAARQVSTPHFKGQWQSGPRGFGSREFDEIFERWMRQQGCVLHILNGFLYSEVAEKFCLYSFSKPGCRAVLRPRPAGL